MKILHQISLFVLTLIFLFSTFIIGIYAFGWLPETYLPVIAEYIYNNLEVGLIAAILFFGGIWLLQSLFIFKPAVQNIVQQTEMGEIRISVVAIKGLVEQIVLEQSGIKDVKSKFDIRDDNFNIYLKLSVNSEAHIPALNQTVGEQVKERLLTMVGLHVGDVKLLVDEIETVKKSSSSTVRVR